MRTVPGAALPPWLVRQRGSGVSEMGHSWSKLRRDEFRQKGTKLIFASRMVDKITDQDVRSLFGRQHFDLVRSLSSDQMGQLSFNASPKKSASSGSGDSFIAVDRNSEHSPLLANFTTVPSNFSINVNCAPVRENFLRISDLCSPISSKAKDGDIILGREGATTSLFLSFIEEREEHLRIDEEPHSDQAHLAELLGSASLDLSSKFDQLILAQLFCTLHDLIDELG